MKQYEHSKSSLFLMELLLNLLLFCVLCGCGLMFFIKSNNMTQNTTDLHQAVRIVTSIASVYETGDGSLDSLQQVHPACDFGDIDSVDISPSSATLYYNEDYAPCSMAHSYYMVTVDLTQSTMNKATIVFYNEKGEVIYSMDAFHYTPSTLESVKEEPAL